MAVTHPARDRELLPPAAGPRPRRVLVVANQTATSPALILELHAQAAGGNVQFQLVVPALNGRLRHWLSDIDDAVTCARRRGEEAMAVLGAHGLTVEVMVGDSVPLLAIEDALAGFDADEIVISTLPAGESHWLERDLVARARQRCEILVRHVVTVADGRAQPTAPTRSRRHHRRPPRLLTSA